MDGVPFIFNHDRRNSPILDFVLHPHGNMILTVLMCAIGSIVNRDDIVLM